MRLYHETIPQNNPLFPELPDIMVVQQMDKKERVAEFVKYLPLILNHPTPDGRRSYRLFYQSRLCLRYRDIKDLVDHKAFLNADVTPVAPTIEYCSIHRTEFPVQTGRCELDCPDCLDERLTSRIAELRRLQARERDEWQEHQGETVEDVLPDLSAQDTVGDAFRGMLWGSLAAAVIVLIVALAVFFSVRGIH